MERKVGCGQPKLTDWCHKGCGMLRRTLLRFILKDMEKRTRKAISVWVINLEQNASGAEARTSRNCNTVVCASAFAALGSNPK